MVPPPGEIKRTDLRLLIEPASDHRENKYLPSENALSETDIVAGG
jgi:hypothetical protein